METGLPIVRRFIIVTIVLAAVLFSFLSIVQPFDVVGERFIGRSDSAATADLARNIAEGKGAVVDCISFLGNGGLPNKVLPQPSDYQPVYLGVLLAGFMLLFHDGAVALQVAAWVFLVATAALSGWIIHYCTKSYWFAVAGFLCLLFSPTMLGSAMPRYELYQAFFILFSLVLGSLAWSRVHSKTAFAAGVISGIAVGIKTTGILVPLGLLVISILYSERRNNLKLTLWMLLGMGIALLPASMYNYIHFDTLNPTPYANKIIRSSEEMLHRVDANQWTGATKLCLDPAPVIADPISTTEFIARTRDRLKLFQWHLVRSNIFPLSYLPLLLLLVVVILRKTAQARMFSRDPGTVFTLLGGVVALASVWILLGVHFEPRYFLFLLPIITTMFVLGFRHLPNTIALAVLAGYVGYTVWTTVQGGRIVPAPQPVWEEFRQAKQLIPEGSVVFNNGCWDFAYHTRLPTVSLPYTDDPILLLDTAKKYGVTYLVSVRKNARNAMFDDLKEGRFPEYLEKIYYSPSLIIGRFKDEFLTRDYAKEGWKPAPFYIKAPARMAPD